MFFFITNNVRLIISKIVNNSGSGHPGMPMGISDIFSIFWYKYYKTDFKNLNKDKLIISNGHGVLIQYIFLYFSNIYKLKDLKKFRKIFSKTPAHPEKSIVIDASTGPLGQGIGIGIGIGLKQKILEEFNLFFNIFNNKIWIFCGDGCMMEGICNEVTSFCGVYNINNIILIFDSNQISIDGKVKKFFNDDIRNKFLSLNWNVIGPINGHCFISIYKSLKFAKKSFFPTLIIFDTIIGFLSPEKSYTEFVHGSIFKKKEYLSILKNYIIKKKYIKKILFKNKIKYLLYFKNFFKKKFFYLIKIINKIFIINLLNIFIKNYKICDNKSTRFISSKVLNFFCSLKEIIIGSADLSSSNLTINKKTLPIKRNLFLNRYINYGVREFGMSLINYGLSDSIGYSICSTFLVFMNYMYSGIRNSSMSKISTVFLFTHDSFSIGEDGPSHQPLEHIKSLRSISRLYLFRPFNLIEVILSWFISLKLKKNCSSIILSRQNFLNEINFINIKNIIKGGYSLFNNNNKKNDLLILSNGSDIEICIYCYKYLKKYFNIKVISIYCNKIFQKQKKIYKKKIINSEKIIVVESTNDDSWYKIKSKKIFLLNIKKFGKSGDEKSLKKYYSINKKILIKLCLYIIKL